MIRIAAFLRSDVFRLVVISGVVLCGNIQFGARAFAQNIKPESIALGEKTKTDLVWAIQQSVQRAARRHVGGPPARACAASGDLPRPEVNQRERLGSSSTP